MRKILCRFQKCNENFRKIFGFGDNYVWACCRNFSQFGRQNLWEAVKGLKNNPKTSHLTRTDVLQLNLSESNGKLGWKRCRSGFSSVLDPIRRYLPKGVVKEDLSRIQVTTFLGVNNTAND